MSSVKDVNAVIPAAGKKLILVADVDRVIAFRILDIVAVVDHVLHFRIFDGDGKKIADTDEKKLPDEAEQIKNLRKQLESLWSPHELTQSEKDQVISAVTSSVALTQVRQELEDGKKNAPTAAAIYEALANLELRAGRVDKAIEVLESGLESATDKDYSAIHSD